MFALIIQYFPLNPCLLQGALNADNRSFEPEGGTGETTIATHLAKALQLDGAYAY